MFALLTTAFLFAGTASQAQPVTPSPSPTSAPIASGAPAAPEEKICRRVRESGSMMPRRMCYTQFEWDLIARVSGHDSESLLRDYRSRHSN